MHKNMHKTWKTLSPTMGKRHATTNQQQQNRCLRTDSSLSHWGGVLKNKYKHRLGFESEMQTVA